MAFLLMALGYVIAEAVGRHAGAQGAGVIGVVIALIIWLVMTLVTFVSGDKILLAVSRARAIEKGDHPQLFNVVEEMTIAAGLPKMPAVYVIDDMALNAFATGRNPEHAAVAVTAGLLGKLNRDQLQGVIAHEMSHVINRDVLFMTIIGIMLGSIVIISQVFLRSFRFGGRRRYGSSSRQGGQGQALMLILAIVLAILAPILANLIYLMISRRREYLADANAAVLTRYPDGLASALEVIANDTVEVSSANRATAPMYIANPFKKMGLRASSFFSTHPPIEERIRILRSMGGTVSYGAYQQAWKEIGGKSAGRLPESAIHDSKAQPARGAYAEPAKKGPKEQLREAGDLLRKVNRFVFLPCVCGLTIKLPPDFKQDHVECPRCHQNVAVPVAQLAAAEQMATAAAGQGGDTEVPEAPAAAAALPLAIARTPGVWQSFKCSCGGTVTLSPSFLASEVRCGACGRAVRVDAP